MLTGFRRLAAACFYILASTTPKGPIMRNFVLLMMMLLAGSVGAQAHYAFTVLPAMTVPEQAFLIRVELTPPSCTALPGALGATSPNGNVVSYYLDVPDFCWLPLPDATRLAYNGGDSLGCPQIGDDDMHLLVAPASCSQRVLHLSQPFCRARHQQQARSRLPHGCSVAVLGLPDSLRGYPRGRELEGTGTLGARRPNSPPCRRVNEWTS